MYAHLVNQMSNQDEPTLDEEAAAEDLERAIAVQVRFEVGKRYQHRYERVTFCGYEANMFGEMVAIFTDENEWTVLLLSQELNTLIPIADGDP